MESNGNENEKAADKRKRKQRQTGKSAKSGEGNLLALSVDAARASCTVGEISFALEQEYGRFQPSDSLISGVFVPSLEHGHFSRRKSG